MKAALVHGPDQPPVYGDYDAPVAGEGENLIAVAAAAITHLTKARASGRHYSASGSFPFVAGVDGVGRLEDGRRVYFVLPRAPFGAMAEFAVAPAEHCVPLPAALDDVTAAAIANPGMSSWAAFSERAKLQPGETVLINGATGASGRLAVRIARHLGAAKVIATGRNAEALAALGADAAIPLAEDEDELERRFKPHFAEGIDVVLDYLWGTSARALLIAGAKAGKDGVPIRFVQIGAVSGGEIGLPAAVLRASAIELMGSGIGSVAPGRLIAAVAGVLEAAVPAGLAIPAETHPLERVGEAWARQGQARLVLTVGG